jgi:SPP1 gp7 family putative phage head morphogenesis protein
MNLNEFMKIPFEDGLQNFIDRYPILADSSEELSRRYSEENVFGLVRSSSMILTGMIQKKLQGAIEQGLTEEETVKMIRDFSSQLSKQYTSVVFRTNINTAFNHGRQKQAEEFPQFIVGFEFSSSHDSSTRENHMMTDGFRAPSNHEAWNFLTPPLGYQCRCVIRQITRPEAKAKKWLDESGNLIPYHPKIGKNPSLGQLFAIGAKPDTQNFGSRVV